MNKLQNHITPRKNAYPSIPFFFAPLVLLFFISALKDDSDVFANSVHWKSLTASPITSLVKNSIILFYVSLAISAAFYFYRMRNYAIHFTPATSILAIIYISSSIIMLYHGSGSYLKYFVYFIMVIYAQAYISSLIYGRQDIIKIVQKAFIYVSAALVVLNSIEYVTGNGYVTAFPRFFGTSSHPNFLGVQMAICALSIMMFETKKKYHAVIKFSFISAALFIIYLSGSRTGISIFLSGYIATTLLKGRLSTFGLGILALGAIFLAVFFALDTNIAPSDIYDRSSGATRTEVWAQMWEDIKQSPIIGHGQVLTYIENSLLRGWVVVGLIYPALFISVLITIIIQIVEASSESRRNLSHLLGIMAGLLVGSIFEGYLFDTNSLPIHTWVICLITVSLYLSQKASDIHRPSTRHINIRKRRYGNLQTRGDRTS